MNEKPILLRGASAGSGKTHFLAKTYIRLLLEQYFHPEHLKDAYQYRHVLAVTFTNKATAEMKERILNELNILAHTPSQSDYYQEFVQGFNCTDEALQTAAGEILFRMLHEYGAFSVSTIDSFFQLVLRSFSREIGYYSSYQVELDRAALIGECVDRILDSLDEGEDNEELLRWLSRKAVSRVANGEKFSSDALLLEVANKLMTDHYKEALKKSRMNEDELYDHDRLIRLEDTCRNLKKTLKSAVKKAAQEVRDEAEIVLGTIKTSREVLEKNVALLSAIDEDSRDGIPGMTDAAYAKLFLPVGAVDTDAWFKKADQAQFANGNGLEGLLAKMDLLRQAYDEGKQLVATLDIIIGQVYGFGVVGRIRQELSAMMKEKNVLGLDETNEILKDLISDTATPFIYEKVGVRYENFLLDEFQDTSHVQWDNFRPLLQESVDNGHTDLVVGDPKQSIYRWRNSDATLMTKVLPDTFGTSIDDTQELDTNWRSAEEIVRFNNAFFAFAAERMDAALEQGRVLQDIYRDVSQNPNDRKGGYVRLDFCEGRETEEGKVRPFDVEIEKVFASIQDAVAHGFRYGDITIVVRKGSQGVSLATYLTEKGIKVSTSDTLGIASSSIVRLLISLLSNRDDPNDSARAYLAEHFFPGLKTDAGDCSLVDICEGLLREIKIKRPDEFNEQIPYIRCFMDVLNDFVARGDNSLHSFVRYISQRDDAISAPESQDAVNIITIHKVKGLAAPYIIAPFVDTIEWARVDGKGESVWCVPELTGTKLEGQAEGVYQVNLTAGMAKGSHFEKSYQEERRLEFIDNLNVLYVAFTRPKVVLHIISAVPKKADETASFPALLRDFSQTYMTELEPGSFEKGVFTTYVPKADKKRESRPLSLEDGYPSYPRGKRVQLKADASDFFKSEAEKPADTGRVNGTILHDILSHVVYPDDLPNAVRSAVLSGALEAEKEQKTLQFLKARIDRAVARGWFPAADSEWVIRNEATILAPKADWNPDGPNLRTDRVLDNGSEVVVIDYKTGRPHSKYEEDYHQQMVAYAGAYRAMGRRKVTTHLWYLGPDEVETRIFESK